MVRADWTFAAVPATRETVNQVRVRELLLRLPPGSPPGGEMVVERLGPARRAERLVIPLEPTEAGQLLSLLVAGLRAVLTARTLLAPGAVEAPAPAAPAEPEAPVLRLG